MNPSKHAIKRVDCFLSNMRFDHRRAQEQLLRVVIGPQQRVLIAVDGFFTWLSQALSEGVEAVVFFDRGFKRVELVKHLRRRGLSFVIRTGGNVHVEHPRYIGRMDQLIQRRGQHRDLNDARLRPSRPIDVRVVALWQRGVTSAPRICGG